MHNYMIQQGFMYIEKIFSCIFYKDVIVQVLLYVYKTHVLMCTCAYAYINLYMI